MVSVRRKFHIIALTLLMVGAGACASQQKTATGPNTTPAAEAKQAAASATPAKTEAASPTAQEQNDQNAAAEAERQKQLEMEKLKAEEEAKKAAANVFAANALEKVYFDFDKYNIKPQFRSQLEKEAAAIKNHLSAKVVVEGHCDERGTEEYNLALGNRRASAVKEYMVSLGVNGSQLHAVSYGEERPADPSHDKNAWALNRRVQFSQE